MNEEKKAMNEILNFFYEEEGVFPHCLEVSMKPKDLYHRLKVLTFGYGSRTYRVLKEAFPCLQAELGEEAWQRWGLEFSLKEAMKTCELGLLPPAFGKWLLTKKELSHSLVWAIQRDLIFFELAHRFYDQKRAILKIESLADSGAIHWQETVMSEHWQGASYFFSRHEKETFLQKVPAFYLEIRNQWSQGFTLDQLASFFSNPALMADFLHQAVAFSWFKRAE